MLAEGGGDHVGRDERSGSSVAAEFVGEKAEVDQPGAADRAAPVLFAHQQRGPPEFGPAPPVRRIESGLVVAERAERVGRHLLRQESRHASAEESLIVAQAQQH